MFALLTANVDAIEALCATRPSDAPDQIYAFASAMVDMAGYLDVPTFFEAACRPATSTLPSRMPARRASASGLDATLT